MPNKIKFEIQIPFETAVRKGLTTSGRFVLEPTEAEMQSLTPEEREILLWVPYNTEHEVILIQLYRVGRSESCDFSAVKPLLAKAKEKFDQENAEEAARQAERVATKEAECAEKAACARALVDLVRTNVQAVVLEKTWSHYVSFNKLGAHKDSLLDWSDLPGLLSDSDRDVLDLITAESERRAQEVQRLKEAEKAQAEAEERAAQARERDFLAKHGTAEQLERYDDGFLPEEELLCLVRDHFFQLFGDFARYEKLKESHVEHEGECYNGRVSYFVNDASVLDAYRYARLKALRKICEDNGLIATVTPRTHSGKCSACHGRTEVRYSAKITMEWNGDTLSREYAL